ncbi:hypothetical protein [Mesorhizobium sp. IMUNJ 23232]|uniref:hypothetical protein n=1 Tax=Mesorhizobium sp. IMUNJ 23232 TaxID=3376064 RepID=UPI0037AD9C79
MPLATQHVSTDGLPYFYGWNNTILQQLDRAAEAAGSTLIHAAVSGFVWGTSTEDDPGQFTLRQQSLVFEGSGLTYGGGQPNGGTITSIKIVSKEQCSAAAIRLPGRWCLSFPAWRSTSTPTRR